MGMKKEYILAGVPVERGGWCELVVLTIND